MKPIIPLIFCVLFFCSCARDSRNKEQLVDAIVKAEGLNEYALKIKADSVAESKKMAQISYEQMKKSWPNASGFFLGKMQAASDQYTATVYEAWTVDDSMEIWKKAYAVNFTEKELRVILANIESELGQKNLAASKRAVAAWREFIFERSKVAAEKAMAVQSSAIQNIIAEETANKIK